MKLTFLKLLTIIAFCHTNIFPWWVWLWAIFDEMDHYLMMGLEIKILRYNSLMIDHEKELEAQ